MAQQYASNQPTGYHNHIRNIAIVGATGQSGKFMTSALLEKNAFKITAVSRIGSTTTPPAGVHVAAVDYDQPETIIEALKGQDVLIITMSVRAPPEQSAKLIEAAAKAGVPWILPNEFGGDTDSEAGRDTGLGPPKQKDRKLIESLGVSSWIAVATGFWYEYSLGGPGLYGFDIAKRKVVMFDEGKQRLNTTTWPQTGRTVAHLLSLPILPEDEQDKSVTLSSYRNRFVFVASFVVNQREMLESLNRVMGTTDKDWKISFTPAKQRFEDGKKMMQEGNLIGFAYMLYARYFFPGEDSALWAIENEKLGLPKEDLDEYTKEAVHLAESGYYKSFFGIKD